METGAADSSERLGDDRSRPDVAAAVVLFLVLGGALVALAWDHSPRRGRFCSSNLRQIGLAIKQYAQDFNGAYPPSFAELYPEYVDHPRLFSCPYRPSLWRKTKASGIIRAENTSYVYVSGLNENVEPRCILAFDRKDNHDDGANALFMDAHVEWMSLASLEARLDETRTLAQQKGLRVKLLYRDVPEYAAAGPHNPWPLVLAAIAVLAVALTAWFVRERKRLRITPDVQRGRVMRIVAVYAVTAMTASQLPNLLAVYADDLAILRMLLVPFVYLPLLVWAGYLITTSQQKQLLCVVAACGLMSAHVIAVMHVSARHRLNRVEASDWKGPEPGFLMEVLKGGEWGSGWTLDLSGKMPADLSLRYAHVGLHGSGTIQKQALFTQRLTSGGEGEVIDWAGYSYSGNHPTTSWRTEWILPLHVRPFAPRQFWLKRDHRDETSRLFVVRPDGQFETTSAWWVLLPWALSLAPIAAAVLLRKRRLLATLAPWVLVLLWCFAFAPWRSWGIGLALLP